MGNAGNSCRRATALSVHPHVHGERLHHQHRPHSVCGSSPRTWGTPLEYRSTTDPSVHPHVWERTSLNDRRSPKSVIPRIRNARVVGGLAAHGSSPRPGEHIRRGSVLRRYRFIPTSWGTRGEESRLVGAVHPHGHGERFPSGQFRNNAFIPTYKDANSAASISNGSSPRMGTLPRRCRGPCRPSSPL